MQVIPYIQIVNTKTGSELLKAPTSLITLDQVSNFVNELQEDSYTVRFLNVLNNFKKGN